MENEVLCIPQGNIFEVLRELENAEYEVDVITEEEIGRGAQPTRLSDNGEIYHHPEPVPNEPPEAIDSRSVPQAPVEMFSENAPMSGTDPNPSHSKHLSSLTTNSKKGKDKGNRIEMLEEKEESARLICYKQKIKRGASFLMPSICFWNIRGLSNPVKLRIMTEQTNHLSMVEVKFYGNKTHRARHRVWMQAGQLYVVFERKKKL